MQHQLFTHFVRSAKFTRQLQRLSAIALVSLALLVPSVTYAQGGADADTGDAPDSTNQVNQKMETYPGSGIVANYPTTFADPAGVPGPTHWYPTLDAWLGNKVSGEMDADLLPDADGVTNIDPVTGMADQDALDDGVDVNSIFMDRCKRIEFRYQVTVAANNGFDRYLNIWMDFNRDGDWDDTLTCKYNGQVINVPEWAVQNDMSTTALVPGFYTFSTPTMWVTNPPTPDRPLWMRVTLSEQKAPISAVTGTADGQGSPFGYRIGETEDYLLTGK